MAKAKSTPAAKTRAAADQSVRELGQLASRIQTVIGTSICVELALVQQNGDFDREIARCVRENVTHALYDLDALAQKVYRRLGGQPFPALHANTD